MLKYIFKARRKYKYMELNLISLIFYPLSSSYRFGSSSFGSIYTVLLCSIVKHYKSTKSHFISIGIINRDVWNTSLVKKHTVSYLRAHFHRLNMTLFHRLWICIALRKVFISRHSRLRTAGECSNTRGSTKAWTNFLRVVECQVLRGLRCVPCHNEPCRYTKKVIVKLTAIKSEGRPLARL